jgi:hypothetical protein
MQHRVSVGIVIGIVPIFILCMNWPFQLLLMWIGISTLILVCLCIEKPTSPKENEHLKEGFLQQSTLQKVVDA